MVTENSSLEVNWARLLGLYLEVSGPETVLAMIGSLGLKFREKFETKRGVM